MMRKDKGYLLVEALITLSLMGVGYLVVSETFWLVGQTLDHKNEQRVLINCIQEKMLEDRLQLNSPPHSSCQEQDKDYYDLITLKK